MKSAHTDLKYYQDVFHDVIKATIRGGDDDIQSRG